MKKSFNFDKVSFLSEQPEKSTDFLSSFLETQVRFQESDRIGHLRPRLLPITSVDRPFGSEIFDSFRSIFENHKKSFASFIDDKISEKRIGDFDDLICRIIERHTNIDSLDELPLAKIIEMESEIEVPIERRSHRLEIDITHQPMAEFPNLYSAPLLSIAQRDPTWTNPISPTQNPLVVTGHQFPVEHPTPPMEKGTPVDLQRIHYQFIEKIIKGRSHKVGCVIQRIGEIQ